MSRDWRSVKSKKRAADRKRQEKAAEREERMKAADREEKAAERKKRARAAERNLELRRMEYEFRKLEMTRADPQRQVGTDMGFGLDEKMAGGTPAAGHFGGAYQNIWGRYASRFTPNAVRERGNAPIFRGGRKTFRNVRRS